MKRQWFVDIKRKLWHFSGIAIAIGYYYWVDKPLALLIVGIFGFLSLLLDLIRLKFPAMNERFIQIFSFVLKPEEKQGFNASTSFLIGSFISILLFSKMAAIYSIATLAICDPVASIVGRGFGRIRIGTKTLEGSVAFCLTAWILSYIVFYEPLVKAGVVGPSAIITLGGAIFAAFVEWAPLIVDDNLKIPILVGGYYHFMLPLL